MIQPNMSTNIIHTYIAGTYGKEMMNQNIKTKLLAALRSNEYTPNKNGFLREHPNFTKRSIRHNPYGILCELFKQETGNGKWQIFPNPTRYDFISTSPARIKESGNGEYVLGYLDDDNEDEDHYPEPGLISDVLVWSGLIRMFNPYAMKPHNKSLIITTIPNMKYRNKEVYIWYKPLEINGYHYKEIIDVYNITHDFKLLADLIEEQL
jgi:hypothetical protein